MGIRWNKEAIPSLENAIRERIRESILTEHVLRVTNSVIESFCKNGEYFSPAFPYVILESESIADVTAALKSVLLRPDLIYRHQRSQIAFRLAAHRAVTLMHVQYMGWHYNVTKKIVNWYFLWWFFTTFDSKRSLRLQFLPYIEISMATKLDILINCFPFKISRADFGVVFVWAFLANFCVFLCALEQIWNS